MLTKNRLLAALPENEREILKKRLSPVDLEQKVVLGKPGDPMRYVYFPTGAVVSLLVTLESGGTVEAAIIGNEGMVGLFVFLGGREPPGQLIVQSPGRALRMDAEDFRAEVSRHEGFHQVMLRYTHARVIHLIQTAACNRLHTLRQRLSQRLLMAHDRAPQDDFPITHETLSDILGASRTSVSLAASDLQKSGLIEYSRGRATILNRRTLESNACECYRIVKAEYDRLSKKIES